MAAVYAQPQDLVGIWRPLSDPEETVVTNLLRYVSAMLRHRVPRLDERIAGGMIDPLLVQLATVIIVKRVMMNPEAARQKSTTTGPFTESITIDSAVSSGALYVSDDDLGLFLPVTPTAAKVGTINLGSGLG